MRDIILKKFKNKDYSLTNYEISFLRDNSTLKMEVLELLNNEENSWNEDLYKIIRECIDIDVVSLFQNSLYNFIECKIEYDHYSRTVIVDSINYLQNTSKKEQLLSKYNNKILDKDYLELITLDEVDLIYLLDNKQYELLSCVKRITSYNRPSLNFITRLHNEFPFETCDYPNFLFGFHDHIYMKYLDYLGLESLFIAISEPRLSSDDIAKIKECINKKIDNSKSLDKELFSYLFQEEKYYPFKKKYTVNEAKDLANKLLDKNSIVLYEYLDHDDITTKKIEVILDKYPEQNILFSDNDEEECVVTNSIIDSLANNGQFGFLLDLYREQKEINIKAYIYKTINNILIYNPILFENDLKVISTGEMPSLETFNLVLNTSYVQEIFVSDSKIDYDLSIIKYLNKNPNTKLNFNMQSLDSLKRIFIYAAKNDSISLLYNLIDDNNLTNSFYDILSNYLNNSNITNLLGNCLIEKVLKNEKILSYFLDNNLYIFEIIKIASENNFYNDFFNIDNYNKIKEYIANYYNVYISNLDKLESICGPCILKYLDSENIINILHLDTIKFNKVIDLFEYNKYTIVDVEAIYDAVKQYNFSVQNPLIFNIYDGIINDKSIYKEELSLYIDDVIINRIDNKYNIKFTKNNIIEKILLNINSSEIYINILHDLVNYYILKKREEYRLSYKNNIYNEIKLPFKYDKKNVCDQGANYALRNSNVLVNDDNTMYDMLLMKTGFSDFELSLLLSEYNNQSLSQNNHSLLKKWAIEIIHDNFDCFYKNNINKFNNSLRKEYFIPDNKLNIIDTLNHININNLESVLENEDEYNTLKNIMKTKKIAYFPSFIKEFLKKELRDINYTENDEINFINYFSNIYKKEKMNANNCNITFPLIFKYGSLYNGLSNIYTQILGQEDAELISLNPGQLRAHYKTDKQERLNIACNLTVNNFLRKEVYVPTFNEIFEYKNKKIRVVVGNFTAPYTLTHGERTDSCMRIGGIGETLFEYALTEKNGFHITFLDADTNEYLSRATCFRNGNSIFINGLRHSLNYDKINDCSLAKVLQMACKKIINETTNSKYPIDNAFVFDGYAIVDLSLRRTNLGVPSIKKNLKGFYSDIGSTAIVLCNRNKELNFDPIIFNTNYDSYYPARYDTIYSTNLHDVYNLINRVSVVNKLIKLKKYNVNKDIMSMGVYVNPIEINNGLIECYVNYDLYIYVDNDYNIHYEYIEGNPKVEEEINNYKEYFEKKYSNKKVRK